MTKVLEIAFADGVLKLFAFEVSADGKTDKEGLLVGRKTFALEILCGLLDGSKFLDAIVKLCVDEDGARKVRIDGADKRSAERIGPFHRRLLDADDDAVLLTHHILCHALDLKTERLAATDTKAWHVPDREIRAVAIFDTQDDGRVGNRVAFARDAVCALDDLVRETFDGRFDGLERIFALLCEIVLAKDATRRLFVRIVDHLEDQRSARPDV